LGDSKIFNDTERRAASLTAEIFIIGLQWTIVQCSLNQAYLK